VDAARDRGIQDAWKMEQQLVQRTGRGSRIEWSDDELEILRQGGRPSGYVGHHITSVGADITKAADHRNVEFLTKAEHDARHAAHGGTRSPITENRIIDRTMGGQYPDLATEGAKSWPQRAAKAIETVLDSRTFAVIDMFDPTSMADRATRSMGDRGIFESPEQYFLRYCGSNPGSCNEGQMMNMIELLKLQRFPDLARLRDGYVAVHLPDVGDFAFKIGINDPLTSESIEKIVDFGAGADPDMIRQLYGLCNGLRVAKFGVYGLLSGPWGWMQPGDINVPNCYGRPTGFPEDYLIVGTHQDKDAAGKTLKRTHCITGDGQIVVIDLENHETVLREYGSVEDWLRAEAERALAE
jgi:hypothetical protein